MVGVGYGSIAPRFLREDGVRTATANERRLLSLLRRDGPMTRAQLARGCVVVAAPVQRFDRTRVVAAPSQVGGPIEQRIGIAGVIVRNSGTVNASSVGSLRTRVEIVTIWLTPA